jgi:hypothetical protein
MFLAAENKKISYGACVVKLFVVNPWGHPQETRLLGERFSIGGISDLDMI